MEAMRRRKLRLVLRYRTAGFDFAGPNLFPDRFRKCSSSTLIGAWHTSKRHATPLE
jgi:hypothetical protein